MVLEFSIDTATAFPQRIVEGHVWEIKWKVDIVKLMKIKVD